MVDVKKAYEQWLADFANDPETVEDLKAIAGNDAEIQDRFYTGLSFGTAGMRGVLGAGTNRMNKYNVRRNQGSGTVSDAGSRECEARCCDCL